MAPASLRQPLKVTFLGPYPLRQVFRAPGDFRVQRPEHPAPWMVNLAMALGEVPGIQLSIVALHPELRMDRYTVKDGIAFQGIAGGRWRLRLLSGYQLDRLLLQRALDQIKPDVVHAFGTEVAYGYAGVLSAYPCVIYMQSIMKHLARLEPGFTKKSLGYRVAAFFERITVRRGHFFNVENASTIPFITELNPWAHVAVIPNLISPLFFDLSEGEARAERTLLYAGGIQRRKGIFELLRALKQVIEVYPDVRLRIMGLVERDIEADYRALVSQLGLDMHIDELGLVDRQTVAHHLHVATALVHPAQHDPSPNIVYEAMLAGTPVIATAVGGLPCMIENGVTGRLVPPHDPAALARVICELLAQPALRLTLGKAGRCYAEAHLAPDVVLGKVIALYEAARERSRL